MSILWDHEGPTKSYKVKLYAAYRGKNLTSLPGYTDLLHSSTARGDWRPYLVTVEVDVTVPEEMDTTHPVQAAYPAWEGTARLFKDIRFELGRIGFLRNSVECVGVPGWNGTYGYHYWLYEVASSDPLGESWLDGHITNLYPARVKPIRVKVEPIYYESACVTHVPWKKPDRTGWGPWRFRAAVSMKQTVKTTMTKFHGEIYAQRGYYRHTCDIDINRPSDADIGEITKLGFSALALEMCKSGRRQEGVDKACYAISHVELGDFDKQVISGTLPEVYPVTTFDTANVCVASFSSHYCDLMRYRKVNWREE